MGMDNLFEMIDQLDKQPMPPARYFAAIISE